MRLIKIKYEKKLYTSFTKKIHGTLYFGFLTGYGILIKKIIKGKSYFDIPTIELSLNNTYSFSEEDWDGLYNTGKQLFRLKENEDGKI